MKLKPSTKPGKNRRKFSTPAAPANIQLKTLLATTDFSDAARSGVRYAVTLAEHLGATVSLLHVIEPPSWMAGMGDVPLVREDSDVVASARAQLAALAKREGKGDVAVSFSVRTGKPYHEITTAADNRAADLIVIATHGYTGLEHVLLGSTAERVVRHAPCPVLTIPARALPKRAGKAAPFKLKKILVPIDFSNHSKAALPWATLLAAQFNAELVLLVREDSDVVASARAQLAALAKREGKGDVAVSFSVRTGKPYHEITTAADNRAADLIVIATHGYTGLEHVLLGSTAERVVRHAPCPVLTIPARALPKRAGKAAPFKLKKILVPIDFSNHSKAALPWATLLAAQFNAELVLLHVAEKFPIDYLLGRELMSEMIVPALKQAEADLELMAAGLSKSTSGKISAVVREGKPYDAICEAAKAMGADLIVLTTHGYTGLKHVWLGSTAERVVRHSPCPVLAVRELNRK